MKKLSQEEAAKVLEDMKVKIEIPKAAVTQWKRNTALDMAIEALKCSEVPNGSDCISRQAAIKALDKRFDSIPMEQTTAILLLRRDLRELPPAEPKRIRGKWIYGEDSMADCVDGYRCDQCGFFVPWDYQHKSIDYIKDYNFCPNCGADMRGELNEP